MRLRDGAPRGPVLAVETSSSEGSVALALDGSVAASRGLGAPSRHSAELVPAIAGLLDGQGLAARDLAGVVVGAGPGSFTGARVAAATAKGLATSVGSPLYAVSSLRAAAVAGGPPPRGERQIRYVLFDARRGRVYGGCYDVGAGGAVEAIAPHGGTILDVINARPPQDAVFTGDGAAAHDALLRAAGFAVRPPPDGVPTAEGLLRCCDFSAVDAAAWEPDYVRAWKPG